MKRFNHSDDSGATLILALLIITTVALVTTATLSLQNVNFKSTVALRNETSSSYAADGAAQVAIKQLQTNSYQGANCATATRTTFAGIIPASQSAPTMSATIQCYPDPGNSGNGGGSNSSPGSALLALAGVTSGEPGISETANANGTSVKVSGGIFSDSTITLNGNHSNLQNTATGSYVYSMGNCVLNSSTLSGGTPGPICNYNTNPVSAVDRRGMDPGTVTGHGTSFDAPPAPTQVMTPPTCSSATVYELSPGLYRSAAALNALTNGSGCNSSVWHFNPGVYYFDFTDSGSHLWTISQGGYLVGGKANVATLTYNAINSLPAGTPSCVAPAVGATTPNTGVEFVFGGDSRMYVTQQSSSRTPNVQICASNSQSGPPIAIYGLKSSIGSGPMAVAGEDLCVTATGYTTAGGNSAHCPVLQTTSNPNPALIIYGTTYVPAAVIDLFLNNNTVQVFRWGLVARDLFIGATGSPNLSSAVVSVPNDAPAPFATPDVFYLNVYVCPGTSACATSGTPNLQVEVQLSITTPTTVTILSWSRLR